MKLYIFDMGGVVVGNTGVAAQIAAALVMSEADFYRGTGSAMDAGTSPYNLGDTGALMRGDIATAEFWRRFTERTGIAITGDPWYDYFNPLIKPDTVALIARLRADGHRVVCGTNTLDAHYRRHVERGDYDYFDATYASHLMGVIKPHPDFWRQILDAEHVAPADACFIDDLQENVDAAATLGIDARLFTDASVKDGSLFSFPFCALHRYRGAPVSP